MISRSASSLLARCAVLSTAAMSGLVVRLKSEVMRRRRSRDDLGIPSDRRNWLIWLSNAALLLLDDTGVEAAKSCRSSCA